MEADETSCSGYENPARQNYFLVYRGAGQGVRMPQGAWPSLETIASA